MRLPEFQRICTMLAREHKIKIKEGNAWAANIKERDVFFKKEDVFSLSEEHILGLILHEIAHIHYTQTVDLSKHKQPELMGSTVNMLEDIAIEHIISNDYPNAGEILDSTRGEVLDKLIQMLPKLVDASVYERSLLFAATRFEGRGYNTGVEVYETLGEEISKLMLSRSNEIYNRKSTKDLVPLAEDIVNIIIKKAGEPTEQEKDQMGQDGMHGEAGKQTRQDETKEKLINELKGGQGWSTDNTQVASNVTFINEIVDQAATIGRQLRTVLKRNNAMEFGGRYRSGKIMTKRFVRTKTIKDRRPFARRIIKSNQSYAFAIASDVSGSMFTGAKIDPASYALSSLHMVAEALRIAGIPRSMLVFGNDAIISNNMGKKPVNWTEIADRQKIRSAGQGTEISRAVKVCTTQLDNVRAERKIMIILTDGESDIDYLEREHKLAQQKGIECIAITIGGGSLMGRIFGKDNNRNVNTRDTSAIGKAFVDILKATIKNSP